MIVVGAAAIGRGLAGSQADDAGFDSSLSIKTQRSAETAGFVIRMRGYDHHAQHVWIVSRAAELLGLRRVGRILLSTAFDLDVQAKRKSQKKLTAKAADKAFCSTASG